MSRNSHKHWKKGLHKPVPNNWPSARKPKVRTSHEVRLFQEKFDRNRVTPKATRDVIDTLDRASANYPITQKLCVLCPQWKILALADIAFLEEVEALLEANAEIGP